MLLDVGIFVVDESRNEIHSIKPKGAQPNIEMAIIVKRAEGYSVGTADMSEAEVEEYPDPLYPPM